MGRQAYHEYFLELQSTLSRMKNILRRLFCSHEWIYDGRGIKTVKHFDYECYITKQIKYNRYHCAKCGVIKKDYEI